MLLVVISGLSGSGKSVALTVLEDADFYCVDNLPAPLVAETVRFLHDHDHERVAITVDARSGGSLAGIPDVLATLRSQGVDVRLLFLNSRIGSLVRRFKETRRKHPLSDGTRTLEECLAHEAALVGPLAESAHVIDTSDLAPNALRAWIKDLVEVGHESLTLIFESFGYKNGLPLNADLVFDVRHLPNPFYDPRLRPCNGLDQPVIDFLQAQPDVPELLKQIGDFVERWLPAYRRDNRSYLCVAIGCTGGQHRSVYLSEQLAHRFRASTPVLVRHRQLDTVARVQAGR
jgi:UPF0042 nucleotide-binding protein